MTATRNETCSKCIDRNVYENIGCVSQWETLNVTGRSLRRCSTFDDFYKMMAEYSLESIYHLNVDFHFDLYAVGGHGRKTIL